jgi:hypothetical protein
MAALCRRGLVPVPIFSRDVNDQDLREVGHFTQPGDSNWVEKTHASHVARSKDFRIIMQTPVVALTNYAKTWMTEQINKFPWICDPAQDIVDVPDVKELFDTHQLVLLNEMAEKERPASAAGITVVRD